MSAWQRDWSNLESNLTLFKPQLCSMPYAFLPRNQQVPLSRLRLRTTRICIRRFFNRPDLEHEHCNLCHVPNDLAHHLIDCPEYASHRTALADCFRELDMPLNISNLTRPCVPYNEILKFLMNSNLLKEI